MWMRAVGCANQNISNQLANAFPARQVCARLVSIGRCALQQLMQMRRAFHARKANHPILSGLPQEFRLEATPANGAATMGTILIQV